MSKEIEKKIRELEEELKRTEYNKATEHHIGRIKAKIAKLRQELERRKGAGKGGAGYDIKRSGDASVAIIGPPNTGKSSLFNSLIGKDLSEVSPSPFTTKKVIPGMMEYKGARIQILDLPGILQGASSGKGEGRKILSVARNADLCLINVDVWSYQDLSWILEEMHSFGIRLNKRRPNIKIERRSTGGIEISMVNCSRLDKEEVKEILLEMGISSANVVINEDVGPDELIDEIIGNRAYIPGIIVISKSDMVEKEERAEILKFIEEIGWNGKTYFFSAKNKEGLENIREGILSSLNLIRIFLKPPEGEINYERPLVLKRGATVKDACLSIRKDFLERFRTAKVWGKSAKYPGQNVGLDHVLEDGDILTIFLRK